MLAILGDTVKNKVWQIRVDDEWLRWLKTAAKQKELSAAAYLRMIATERMVADGVPRPSHQPQKRKPGG